MTKFLLGVSVTVNAIAAAAIVGVHSVNGANIAVLYLKNRGYLAERQ